MKERTFVYVIVIPSSYPDGCNKTLHKRHVVITLAFSLITQPIAAIPYRRFGTTCRSVFQGKESKKKRTEYVYIRTNRRQQNLTYLRGPSRNSYTIYSAKVKTEKKKMQLIRCLLSDFHLNMFRTSLYPSSGE